MVRNFNEVERSGAVQVNLQSEFQRLVRLLPPYQLPGYSPPSRAPEPVHFEFKDDDGQFRPFSQRLQDEFRQFLQSAPIPGVALFAEEGRVLCLMGLDQVRSGSSELTQVTVRTQKVRQVRVRTGFVMPTSIPCPPQPACGSTYRHSSSSRAGGTAAPFSWRSATILAHKVANRSSLYGSRSSAGEALAPDARDVVLNQWRKEPRPDRVELPSGAVVEDFNKFEAGKAFIRKTAPPPLSLTTVIPGCGAKAGYTLELQFDAPSPGCIVLPDDLDGDVGFDLASCGKYLSRLQVSQLSAQGGDAKKCSICLCEMEQDFEPPTGNEIGAGFGYGASTSFSSHAAPMFADLSAENETHVFQLTCGHAYHQGCLAQWFNQRKRCPQCQKDYGKVLGDQPARGSFSWYLEDSTLPGHPDARQTIVIQFDFPSGTDEKGITYDGRKPKGYLPCNAQGIVLLELFKVAFRRRVMFGLGDSMTFGAYRPTFNIHIKTSMHRGATGHGYPDDSYFQRSLGELRTNGVTILDLPP